MRHSLEAMRRHPGLRLQTIVTGMHLDPAHGRSVDVIAASGWPIDAVVPWAPGGGSSQLTTAVHTGHAMAGLAQAYDKLESDVVLVVGDRVEAFAAAAAAHVSGKVLAHVHGGDRALGQVDDCLRHAIAKLAHIHFPATKQSANRLLKLGEDRFRVHCVGSPGIDGMRDQAAGAEKLRREFPSLRKRRFALLALHPSSPDVESERKIAEATLDAAKSLSFEHIVIIYPNNDPGSAGIIGGWDSLGDDPRIILRRDVPRPLFLELMRQSAVLMGNSSSGIIEAATVGTPVIDIGPRQAGRERSGNVVWAPAAKKAIRAALSDVWNEGRPRRFRGANVYGGGGAGRRMADILGAVALDDRLRRKLIAY